MKRSAKTSLGAGTMALLLGISSLVNGLQAAKREKCEIKVDYAHLSTYASENDGAIKMKIKANTKCTRAQKYSTIGMKFYEISSNGTRQVRIFDSVKELADKKRPEYAFFEGFEEFCIDNSSHRYFGKASGKVRMKSGKLIKVSGVSEKSISLPCGIPAQ